MEEPFAQAEFEIDYPLYMDFQKFQRRKGLQKAISIATWIACALGGLIFLLHYFLFGFDGDMALLLAVYVAALAVIMFSNFWLPKLRYKSLEKLLAAPQRLLLFSDHYETESSSPQFSGKASFMYEALFMAMKRTQCFTCI